MDSVTLPKGRAVLAWLVLALSLAGTLYAFSSARAALNRVAELRLRNKGDHVRDMVIRRIKAYEHMLVGAKGLFAASRDVDASEWHSYVATLDLPSNFPGVQAIGFSQRVPAAEKAAYEERMRGYGHPSFAITPEGNRPEYFPITFLEQTGGRTGLVLGYDGFAEPLRRQAMVAAMETGKPVITGAVTLRVDSGRTGVEGFLIYVPVFANGSPSATAEDRRSALRGYISAAFRMRDLMAGLSNDYTSDIAFRILDGGTEDGQVMYESRAGTAHDDHTLALGIPLGTRHWTLRVSAAPGFLGTKERSQPWWVMAAGVFISLLLAGLTWSLQHTRARADALAITMTAELRMRNDQLRNFADKAEEATRTKSEFLANMSHELRTPLNSVIGFANILLKNKGGGFKEQDLTYLGRIHENGRHLLALINSILDLSKVEAGKMEPEWSEVDLIALCRETAGQMEGQVKERGLELRLELPDACGMLWADAAMLKQVLINLIGNALKFTEKGGVVLRLRCEAGSPAELQVEDTGEGIPADKLEAIFEAFRQSDNSITRRFGGTGLGLTISRALVRLMDFDLVVSSEQGRGSVFSIRFARQADADSPIPPFREASPAAPDPSPAPPRASNGDLKGKRVLVIDDETDSRMLLRNYLEDLGCEVEEAGSGKDGLSRARRDPPDLITMDLMMPGMRGWDVVRELQSDPRLRRVPVVVVSIVAREDKGGLLGVVDRLDKPVTREVLYGVLKKTLSG